MENLLSGKNLHLLDETLVPLTDAPDVLPGCPSYDTLLEWKTRGLSVPGRHLSVLLECVNVGKKVYTSHEAFRRFVAATSP
jgi:hypothetical protein